MGRLGDRPSLNERIAAPQVADRQGVAPSRA